MKKFIAWFKALFKDDSPEVNHTTATFRNTMDAAVRWDRTAREFKANGWRY